MDIKKKIIIVSAYSGLVNRGVETVVTELCNHLKKDLFVWKIIGGSSHNPYTIHVDFVQKDAGLPIFEKFFISDRRIREFVFYIKAIKQILVIRPNFVMVYNGGWHLLVYKLLSRICDFKLILSGQSGPGWDDRFNLLMSPDAFVCLTKVQYLWAKSISSRQKYWIIPNGVDTKLFYPSNKKKNKKVTVLTVAASEKSKNVEKNIRVLADTECDFLYVGNGTQAKYLDTLGKRLMGTRYKRESLSHEELPETYRKADVFMFLQSDREAFGIVFIEAMASGLPIVCFDDPIRRELLGNNAVYVKDNNESIKKGILLAIKNKNSNRGIFKYDWDFVANLYLKMIMEL